MKQKSLNKLNTNLNGIDSNIAVIFTPKQHSKSDFFSKGFLNKDERHPSLKNSIFKLSDNNPNKNQGFLSDSMESSIINGKQMANVPQTEFKEKLHRMVVHDLRGPTTSI